MKMQTINKYYRKHLLLFVDCCFCQLKMLSDVTILAKNWVRIETPTQVPHLPDLSKME